MNALFALLLTIQAYSVLTDDCSENTCELSETCCPTSQPGVAGCCPVPNAVCCADNLHCCPQNTACNLDKGTCDNKTLAPSPLPFNKLEGAGASTNAVTMKEAKKIQVVYCRGGTSYCPDGQTCCQTPAGQWTCCPYPSAACCIDGLHCCRHGYKCDSTSSYCLPALWYVAPKRPRETEITSVGMNAITMKEAKKAEVVYCPGITTSCSDGETCCKTPAGEYRCCPDPSAACCTDGLHCCPNGYKCDPTSSYCLPALWYVAPKRPRVPENTHVGMNAVAMKEAKKVEVVYCPGGTSYCADGQTCCQTPAGEWRCCPFSAGSCCRDGMYCCQHGYRCLPSHQCVGGKEKTRESEKLFSF